MVLVGPLILIIMSLWLATQVMIMRPALSIFYNIMTMTVGPNWLN